MKLLLMMRGIVSVVALTAAAQTPPATAVGKTSEPVVKAPDALVKAVETTTKPGADLEFKPVAEKDLLPPPPPPIVPKAPAAKDPGKDQGKSAPGPAIQPAGPRVVDAPSDPAATSNPRATSATPLVRPPASGKQTKPYVIGPLDVLEVKVWNDPKLSGIVDVATDGTISMPLIGSVNASGLTAAELVVELKDKLSAVIIEPEVNIQVVRINSKKYAIFGGCMRQGEFPLVGDVTVLDAFANCGGFKDFADLKKIYILRGSQRLKFNYKDVIRGKHMEQNIPLENGDRIVIPE